MLNWILHKPPAAEQNIPLANDIPVFIAQEFFVSSNRKITAIVIHITFIFRFERTEKYPLEDGISLARGISLKFCAKSKKSLSYIV